MTASISESSISRILADGFIVSMLRKRPCYPKCYTVTSLLVVNTYHENELRVVLASNLLIIMGHFLRSKQFKVIFVGRKK